MIALPGMTLQNKIYESSNSLVYRSNRMYSHADEIQIELVYKSTSCFLRVKGNGRGFEVNNKTLSRGFGLLGMTERAEHIGTQLSIESQLGQGTEVIVSVHREATT